MFKALDLLHRETHTHRQKILNHWKRNKGPEEADRVKNGICWW